MTSIQDIRSDLSQEGRAHIQRLMRQDQKDSALAYLKIYLAIFAAVAIAIYSNNIVVYLISIIIIGGRQHSLYILNHDASHYALFKSKHVNKWVAEILSNFVMMHHPEAYSFVQWRRVHMYHHKSLFTNGDPNYVGRQNNGDTQVPLTRRKLIGLCLKAPYFQLKNFFFFKQDYVYPFEDRFEKNSVNHLATLFTSYHRDLEMHRERFIKVVFIVSVLSIVAFNGWWKEFLLLWIVPMYTVYPMILTFMDMTEHRWDRGEIDLNDNTRSVKYGLLSSVVFSFLPRGLHREHHVFPAVPVSRLRQLSLILVGETRLEKPLNGFGALINDI